MQLQLALVTFQYQADQKVRTVTIDGEPWFYASDICSVLEISNPSMAYKRIEKDDLSTTEVIDAIGRRQTIYIVSEYGLYDLIMQSRKEEARKFKRWITHEVIPQIRKTGSFSLAPKTLPNFVRRFNDNWDRVDRGYFSVISELFIRVYGKFEQVGYIIKDKSPKGVEIRPDVSVGQLFPKWLEKHHPEHVDKRKAYKHLLPEGFEVDAWQYKHEVLPCFIEYVETEWLPNHAPKYLEKRDVEALQHLPKLLPPKSSTPKGVAAKALPKSLGNNQYA